MSEKGYYNLTRKPAALTALNRLVDMGAMTVEGRAWLEQYVDCVHWKASGNGAVMAPNKVESMGVASSTTKVAQITCPAALNAAPWDMHIEWDSEWVPYQQANYNVISSLFFAPTGVAKQLGGVTVTASAGGVDCGFATQGVGTSTFITQLGVTDTSQTQMQGRLIAACVKYTDTTPPLYKGGMMHGYRLHADDQNVPTTMGISSSATIAGVTVISPTTVLFRKPKPRNLSNISILPSYMCHAAEKGAFTTVMIDPHVNPSIPDYVNPVYFDSQVANPLNGSMYHPVMVNNGTVPANYLFPQNLQSHTGAVPGGFYLTGLNPQHTGVLTVTYVWEVFPNSRLASELNYTTLQQRGTCWDPMAISIAQLLLARAPCLGESEDNDNWTWIAKTFGSIGEDLGKMIQMIPHPIAQGIGGGVRLAAKASGEYAARQKKKKNKDKNQGKAPRPPPVPPKPRAQGYQGKVVPRTGPKPLPPIPTRRK